MQRFALWLFVGWARPILALATLVLIVEVVWRTTGNEGLAACLGMVGLGFFAFLKALDRIGRVTEEERAARRAATRARRAKRTAFWRSQLEGKRPHHSTQEDS